MIVKLVQIVQMALMRKHHISNNKHELTIFYVTESDLPFAKQHYANLRTFYLSYFQLWPLLTTDVNYSMHLITFPTLQIHFQPISRVCSNLYYTVNFLTCYNIDHFDIHSKILIGILLNVWAKLGVTKLSSLFHYQVKMLLMLP